MVFIKVIQDFMGGGTSEGDKPNDTIPEIRLWFLLFFYLNIKINYSINTYIHIYMLKLLIAMQIVTLLN